jgi:two-component system CheB/CheR fusion protein
VTEFFRDPEAWKIVEEKVLPDIMARKKKGDSIRVWSSGCASGEEPYSVGILLSEALGNAVHDFDVKIYATDIDEKELIDARKASIARKSQNVSPEQLENISQRRRDDTDRPIDPADGRLAGRPGDDNAPISHLTSWICRNVLIY